MNQEQTQTKEFRINNSNLDVLAKSPKLFYRTYISKEQERQHESSFQFFGKAMHYYVLKNDEFEKEYFIGDFEKPSNKMQANFCDAIISKGLSYFDAYQDVYSTKSMSQKLVEENSVKLFMQLNSYIEFIKNPDNKSKILIEAHDYNTIKTINDNILTHTKANELLNYKEKYNSAAVMKEIYLKHKLTTLPDKANLYLDGILDQVIFDVDNRKMIIVELKSTSKPVCKFADSFFEYKYNKQLAIYTILAGKEFERLFPDIPLKEMIPEWYIIAAETSDLNEVRLFKINEIHIQDGLKMYSDLKNRFLYHYEHGWDFPQEYFTNKGIEYI